MNGQHAVCIPLFLPARASQPGQFCPQGHFKMSGDILVVTPGIEGCNWHLMDRDQRGC